MVQFLEMPIIQLKIYLVRYELNQIWLSLLIEMRNVDNTPSRFEQRQVPKGQVGSSNPLWGTTESIRIKSSIDSRIGMVIMEGLVGDLFSR